MRTQPWPYSTGADPVCASPCNWRLKTDPPCVIGWWMTSSPYATFWREPTPLQTARDGSERHYGTPQLHTVLAGPNLPLTTPPPPQHSVAEKNLRAVEGALNGPPFPGPRIATHVDNFDAQDEIDSTNGKYPRAYITLRSMMLETRHRFHHGYLGAANMRSTCLRA